MTTDQSIPYYPLKSENMPSAKSYASRGLILIILLQAQFLCFAQEFHGASLPPEYKGGVAALREFIDHNLKYPGAANEKKIQGVVMVEFTVTKGGKVQDINVLKGINAAYDAEAIRVAGLLNDWQPGKDLGSSVDCRIRMPVVFKGERVKDEPLKHPVSGTVSEECTGRPLGGVLVVIRGTNNGTVTDSAGKFELEIPNDKSELEFMSVRFKAKQVNVKYLQNVQVKLESQVYLIDFDEVRMVLI